jgi:hypothetical protein
MIGTAPASPSRVRSARAANVARWEGHETTQRPSLAAMTPEQRRLILALCAAARAEQAAKLDAQD